MNTLDALDAQSQRTDIPSFRAGDTIKVHARVVEGNRSRVQVFQGVVIRRQGAGLRETFTVRKVSSASVSSAPTRSTARRSTASRSLPAVTCGGQSCTTSASWRGKCRQDQGEARQGSRLTLNYLGRGPLSATLEIPFSSMDPYPGERAPRSGAPVRERRCHRTARSAPGKGPLSRAGSTLGTGGGSPVHRDPTPSSTSRRTACGGGVASGGVAMPLWQELPLLSGRRVLLAVLIPHVSIDAGAFYIPSSSMETTLLIGDRVLVTRSFTRCVTRARRGRRVPRHHLGPEVRGRS
jgi:hypothetical protein